MPSPKTTMKNQWRGTCMNNRHCKKIRWARSTPRSLISLPVPYFQWSQRQLRFIRADEKILMQQNAMTYIWPRHACTHFHRQICHYIWDIVAIRGMPCSHQSLRASADYFFEVKMQRGYGTYNNNAFRRFSENKKSGGDGRLYTSGLGFLKVIDFFVWEIAEHPDGEWTCNEPQKGFRAIKITTARKHRVATAWWKF